MEFFVSFSVSFSRLGKSLNLSFCIEKSSEMAENDFLPKQQN